MDRVFVICDKNNTNLYFIFSVARLSLFLWFACTFKCRGMADCWISSIFLFNSSDMSAVFFFLRQTCVGWSEIFWLDLRPPLVFFLCSTLCRLERVVPAGLSSATRLFVVEDAAPSGARNNQQALLDRGFAFFIAVDGVFNNQPFVFSFPICREELVDHISAASLPASFFDSVRNNQPLSGGLVDAVGFQIQCRRRIQQPTFFIFLLPYSQGEAGCFSAGVLTCFLFRLPFVRQTSFGLKEPLPRERSCLQVRVRTRKLAFVVQGAVAPRTIFVSKCGFGRQNAVRLS